MTDSHKQLYHDYLRLTHFASRLLNPDDLGFAVSEEVRDAAREAIGMPKAEKKEGIFLAGHEITRERLKELLRIGYMLCNYRPGSLDIHRPSGGGGVGYILGQIADELGAVYDRWNFDIWKGRLSGEIGRPGMPKPDNKEAIEDAKQYWENRLASE